MTRKAKPDPRKPKPGEAGVLGGGGVQPLRAPGWPKPQSFHLDVNLQVWGFQLQGLGV